MFAALGSSAISVAQPAPKVHRIGWLGDGSASPAAVRGSGDFQQAMRDAGYSDRNVEVVYRYANGGVDRLPDLAAELVRQKVDVIVTTGLPAAIAAKRATASIPIVATEFGMDPVKAGLVASLGRPGGNVTGLATISEELWEKRLEVLRQIVRRLAYLVVLWNPANLGNESSCLSEIRAAGKTLGVEVRALDARDGKALERAFAEIAREPVDALVACWDNATLEHAKTIADFALRRRLPTMFALREYVDAGGLISFGASLAAHRRRAAHYVDKILKGAKPADLPVERPTHFELVINARTTEGLGVVLPGTLVLLADDVVGQPEARR